MTIHDHALRDELMALSKVIEQLVRREDQTLFFAAFIARRDGTVVYCSNGDRAEVQRLLPALVRRLEGSIAPPSAPTTPIDHTDVRLVVERTCSEVGQVLTKRNRVALFVFKNDEDCPGGVGVNAYFSSLPEAPTAIRAWLVRAKA